MLYLISFILGYFFCSYCVMGSQFEKNHNFVRQFALTLIGGVIFLYCTVKHRKDI